MYILFFVFRRFILQIVKRYLILVSFSFCPFRKDFPVEYFPLGLFFFCVRLLQPLPASVHNPTVKCHPEWQFRLFRVDLLCFNVVSIYHPIHVLLIWIFNSLKFSNRFRGLMLRSCKIDIWDVIQRLVQFRFLIDSICVIDSVLEPHFQPFYVMLSNCIVNHFWFRVDSK